MRWQNKRAVGLLCGLLMHVALPVRPALVFDVGENIEQAV
jgi:hypothetical protein